MASTGSAVGPQNEIDHPAHRSRRLMQVPVLSTRGIQIGSTLRLNGLALRSWEYGIDFRRDNGVLRGLVVVMVVAFSSRARILGECSTIHSPPALFLFLKWRLARAN